MQTAVVAGGAGFIGSHLCEKLLADGYRVICVDNLITSSKKNVEKFLTNPHFSFVEQNVITLSQHMFADEKIDFIFHFASPASPNLKSKTSYMNLPIETLQVNSIGTHNLLELARRHAARFLYASTSEVYGDPMITPQKEDHWGNVNPNGIRSVYDEGKRFGEAMTMAYVRKFNVDARIVRIFNTYGPNMQIDDGRVVSNLINQALKNEPLTIYGEGNQTRSFCYISDLVRGICAYMLTEGLQGEVINMGNPNERSIINFATIIQELTATKSEIVHEPLPSDDPKQRCPDITKAKHLLSWEPEVSLEEGLKKTIAYFENL